MSSFKTLLSCALLACASLAQAAPKDPGDLGPPQGPVVKAVLTSPPLVPPPTNRTKPAKVVVVNRTAHKAVALATADIGMVWGQTSCKGTRGSDMINSSSTRAKASKSRLSTKMSSSASSSRAAAVASSATKRKERSASTVSSTGVRQR